MKAEYKWLLTEYNVHFKSVVLIQARFSEEALTGNIFNYLHSHEIFNNLIKLVEDSFTLYGLKETFVLYLQFLIVL